MPHGIRRLTLLTAGFFVLDACMPRSPSAPSELTEGVAVYEHANFLGESTHIVTNMRSLQGLLGPCRETLDEDGSANWEDCISSIRVAPGWRATLYEDRDFKGWAADVGEENVANYQLVRGPCGRDTFNDCASSIRVFKKTPIP